MTGSELQILVLDDEKRARRKYKELLEDHLPCRTRVTALDEAELKALLAGLERRKKSWREGDARPSAKIALDDIDVLLLDFDLLRILDFANGENLAYLVRCFSDCGIILGLNQYGENRFDLSLKGHPESWADLNIGWRQLVNPGLWGGQAKGFRPSHWPNLPAYMGSLPQRVEDARTGIDEPIWKVVGIPEDIMRFLPRTAGQFLGKDPMEVTFRQFVTSSPYPSGLMAKDAKPRRGHPALPDDAIARIGAARVSKWLERLVLPGQDILVDAPHLAARFPSLLEGGPAKVASWQKTARLLSHKEVGIRWRRIERHRLKKTHWVSRPVWFWRTLSADESIEEVKEPWSRKGPDLVFCEDASAFYKRTDCREFVADTESPYARRFVRVFRDDGVEYEPRCRFSR